MGELLDGDFCLPASSVGASGGGGGGSLQRILVPVDSAGHAAAAVELAARASAAVEGMVRVIHVQLFDPPVRGYGGYRPQASDAAAEVVQLAMVDAVLHGSQASGEVVVAERSRLADAIVAAAQSWEAGVIVLARRPRNAITRLLIGSVADGVMRRARCPVLIVRRTP